MRVSPLADPADLTTAGAVAHAMSAAIPPSSSTEMPEHRGTVVQAHRRTKTVAVQAETLLRAALPVDWLGQSPTGLVPRDQIKGRAYPSVGFSRSRMSAVSRRLTDSRRRGRPVPRSDHGATGASFISPANRS